ncbi:MAG: hypothetical protein LBR88_04585, partial [Zoogloeaceae bacterium]|nr:hypothetical protein [Zoogloeaceae bacterium]
TTHNAQRTTHNAQRTTHNAQRTTHNAQRTTHNAQHENFLCYRKKPITEKIFGCPETPAFLLRSLLSFLAFPDARSASGRRFSFHFPVLCWFTFPAALVFRKTEPPPGLPRRCTPRSNDSLPILVTSARSNAIHFSSHPFFPPRAAFMRTRLFCAFFFSIAQEVSP